MKMFDNYRIMKTMFPSRLRVSEWHVEALRSLAHHTRLQIFFLLARKKGEVPAGEIQAELGIPGPTLSHHLDVLRRAGLVQSRKEERFVYYTTQPASVAELVRLLTACC